jgi:ABC-2 type transport system ATP-binding protein
VPQVDSVTSAGPAAKPADADAAEPTDAAATDDRTAVIEVLSADSGAVVADVVAVLGRAGARILSVEVREPNLESVFLHLTGK